jgi:hypothetical protein
MYADLAPELFANGWRNLLPLGVYSDGKPARDRKACMLPKWSNRSIEPLTEEGLSACVARYPNAGIGGAFGAVHGLVAIDIDVEDPDENERVRSVVRRTLPRTDFIRIGRLPKLLLLYRGCVQSSKPHGLGIEIFGSSGQTVLFSIHPKTGLPYRWPGSSPLDASPADLPRITSEEVNTFLKECCSVLTPNRSTANGHSLGHLDYRTVLANERRMDGAQAAARQLMRLREGERHIVLLSVSGYLVSQGYAPDEIAAFVNDFFPTHLRTRSNGDDWSNPGARAADMAHSAIAKYGDKDWSLNE